MYNPSPVERIAMSQAISLALNSKIPNGPNPKVGCVILDESGQYVGQGVHLGKGSDHAEVVAIKSANRDLTGCTAVISLEPCLRMDRDTDCSRRLTESGISKVIYAQSDLTTQSRGGGQYLERQGLKILHNLMEEEASGINPWFTIAIAQQRPYVSLKVATSLDGKMAAQDGSSRWISSELSRIFTHKMRSEHDVLISSTKTTIMDQSKFEARDEAGSLYRHQPEVKLLGQQDLPSDHPIFKTKLKISIERNRDLFEILAELWESQKLSAMVEAGPTLATAFLKLNLVNQLIWVTSPVLLGSTGISSLGDLGISRISEALRLHLKERRISDVDVISIFDIPKED